MNLEIKPEDIDKYVKQAILDSTVGKSLVIEIEKSIKDMMSSYSNPVKNFVTDCLKKFTFEYMERDDVKALCLEAVAKTITPEVITTIINYGVSELNRRYNDR